MRRSTFWPHRAALAALILLVASLGMASNVSAAPPASTRNGHKPTLIVQLTFDQLRADLLQKYHPAFNGGLARLLEKGWWIREGEVAHGITNSFPGHTSLATGLHPSHHGLTANEWWVEKGGRWTWQDVAADDRYTLTGLAARSGISPRNLNGTSLADWVKAGDPAAKSVALSTGATIAMAYGGRRPDALYWYDGQSGGFVTSTYYAQASHDWISRFNESGIGPFRQQTWSLTVPERFRTLARADAQSYESGGKNNVFPHVYAIESRTQVGSDPTPYGEWFGGTPMKDEALFALAARAVDAERLGQRGATDYLAVLVDSTDSVGHNFGPSSLEQLDTLVRLDRALGAFLDHLDATVGKDNYVLALSADHGVADPPEESGRHRITKLELEAVLDRVEALASSHKGTRESLVDSIVTELRKTDFIADAYSEARLAAPGGDPYAILLSRAFRPGLTPDFPLWSEKERPHHPARYGIIVRFKEGMIFDYAAAVHGSPYAYDRRVPILFYGRGVRAGGSISGARTIDVAPTLATLAGLAPPASLDGKALRLGTAARH